MYNRRQIMKNAWKMKKTENITMSAALKYAWALAKAIIIGEEQLDKYCGHAKIKVNEWRKNDKSRTYIEVRHYTNAWNLKHVTAIGYINNLTGEFFAA